MKIAFIIGHNESDKETINNGNCECINQIRFTDEDLKWKSTTKKEQDKLSLKAYEKDAY